MKTLFSRTLCLLVILGVWSAAVPAEAQMPAFKNRDTSMCLVQHHFTEQDLESLASYAYSQTASQLTPDGKGFGHFAWKMISHPKVGQLSNLGFSLPGELGFSFPGSETLGNALNGFGAVVIVGQLAVDLYTDNPQLQINLAKSTAYWTIGFSKMFSSTMKISSIAVQLFDYTLNELGNAALNGQKHLWYDAYKNYFDTEYGHHVADMKNWDRLVEKNHGNLKLALENMHKEFWGDPFLDSYKKQEYIWSNADLSETAKIEVRDTYLQGMLPVLLNYYRVQQNKARTAAVRKANSIYNGIYEQYAKEIAFSGKVTSASGRPLAGVAVSLYGTHPVMSDAKGEYRTVFRMCQLIPELGKSNNKIMATAYYTPDPTLPPRVKNLTRGLGVGFITKDELDPFQDRLDFVFTTDDWVELNIHPQNVELEGGAQTNLTATCLQDDGKTLDVTHEVEWRSDNDSIADVVGGQLTAKQTKGSANIFAFSKKPGRDLTSKPCRVFVKFQREVEQLMIQPARLELKSNDQAPIQAVALFNDKSVKNVTIDPECKWSSTPPALQVTPQGKVQAGKAVWGAPDHTLKASYTFRAKTVSSSIPVRLLPSEKVNALKINKPEVVMGLNENVGLRVTALIGKGPTTFPYDVTTQVVWKVSDKSIIIQTAQGVIVSGSKEGQCGVQAEYSQSGGPTLRALCNVTVVDKNRPLPALDFSIDPKDDPLLVGQSVTFRSKLTPLQSQLELIWYVDGKEILDLSEITHVFTSRGTYSVRLFVRDRITGKNDAVAKNIHIQDQPELEVAIGFSPKTNVYEIGSTVGFIAKTKNAKGITEYRWYVSGEYVGSGQNGVKHKFTEAGEYEVKLGLRLGSNLDEVKVTRTLAVGEAAIGKLGTWINRFEAVGAPDNLDIKSSYWRVWSGDWSKPISFNGGSIGAVDHYILYTGKQADTYNTGFLVYVPKGKNELQTKVFHFRWPSNPKIGPSPHGIVHYSGWLDLHNKTPIPDSLNFTRKASRMGEVEWRTTDGSSCRARVNKYKKNKTFRFSGIDDLDCIELAKKIETTKIASGGSIIEAMQETAKLAFLSPSKAFKISGDKEKAVLESLSNSFLQGGLLKPLCMYQSDGSTPDGVGGLMTVLLFSSVENAEAAVIQGTDYWKGLREKHNSTVSRMDFHGLTSYARSLRKITLDEVKSGQVSSRGANYSGEYYFYGIQWAQGNAWAGFSMSHKSPPQSTVNKVAEILYEELNKIVNEEGLFACEEGDVISTDGPIIKELESPLGSKWPARFQEGKLEVRGAEAGKFKWSDNWITVDTGVINFWGTGTDLGPVVIYTKGPKKWHILTLNYASGAKENEKNFTEPITLIKGGTWGAYIKVGEKCYEYSRSPLRAVDCVTLRIIYDSSK